MISKTLEKKILKKQKRCQHLITTETKIPCLDEPTENLVICNAGLSTGLQQEALLDEVNKFGEITAIILLPGKSYCFLKCKNTAHSIKIYKGLHGQTRLAQNDGVLYLSYCVDVPQNDNSWNQSLPSGLILLKDFISVEEEERLLMTVNWLDDGDSDGNLLKHRKVRHFGYEFLYGTNNVDATKPLLEQPIPSECDIIWPKIDKLLPNLDFTIPNQLTVNKYEPGQGIPPHVDTHSAFLNPIMSLSLASDVVMEFRNPDTGRHRSVRLPRRSLLIMSDESRFAWTHAITPRKMDIEQRDDGSLTIEKRQQRVSFTFRSLKYDACKCEYKTLCDSFKRQEDEKKTNTTNCPATLEMENVHKVYDEIANHFSETRHSPWPQVEEFVCSFGSGQILVDIGCGNGKYLTLNENIMKIGCDRSHQLLKVCRQRGLNIFQCDCLYIPIKSHSVDGCISIAVIHHLASEERRLQAVQEMARILVVGGRGLIYVWSKNQQLDNKKSSYLRQNKRNNKMESEELDSLKTDDQVTYRNGLPVHTNRTQFVHQDMLVPWKLKSNDANLDTTAAKSETFLRFYHVFEENELETLCSKMPGIKVVRKYYDQGNWCIIFEKII